MTREINYCSFFFLSSFNFVLVGARLMAKPKINSGAPLIAEKRNNNISWMFQREPFSNSCESKKSLKKIMRFMCVRHEMPHMLPRVNVRCFEASEKKRKILGELINYFRDTSVALLLRLFGHRIASPPTMGKFMEKLFVYNLTISLSSLVLCWPAWRNGRGRKSKSIF